MQPHLDSRMPGIENYILHVETLNDHYKEYSSALLWQAGPFSLHTYAKEKGLAKVILDYKSDSD